MIGAAAIAGVGSSTGTTPSLLTVTGLGIGGGFVTVALLAVLAYLNLLEAADRELDQLQSVTVVAAVPLVITFGAILVFEALAVL